jgi:hypothetical protein
MLHGAALSFDCGGPQPDIPAAGRSPRLGWQAAGGFPAVGWSRRSVEPARRRALELLARSADGCAEGIMRARGFSIDFMVELVRAGLATATPSA